MPSSLSTQLITRHSKPDFGTTLLLCKDNWAAWTVHRRANVCLETVLQDHTTAEYRKNPFTQPLSLLLSVSNLSYHQIFSSKPSSWKAAGERVMMLLEREAPTVVQQYAAFSQPFCNRRLKDEREFHLLNFLLQQKCCECLEMGSLAYLR